MTPLLTVLVLLVLTAFICTILHAVNRCPIWVPVVLLCVIEMLEVLPLR